ncbi:MAG: autotransporter-associated beta strand repeat-containing protein, partial [Verrucomicrobia bacterium]|nr:autotransporter-associated beta strand repeat-containing protein [Verrucomicrobiota bacterium]
WSKWGVGTLALSGANTYSGGTVVNAGVLEINDNAALGAVPGTPAVNVTLRGGQLLSSSSLSLAANRNISLPGGGAYLDAGAGTTFAINGAISGADGLGVVWDSGTVVLNGAGSYAGVTTIGVTGNSFNNSAGANPTLQLSRSGALPGTDLIFGTSANANTATLDVHGTANTVARLTGGANAIVDNLSASAGTLTVGNGNASSTFSGIIQNTTGTNALTKIGTGTFSLANANTYLGNTLVNGGTLALSLGGSLLSQVRVGPGATFDVSAQASPFFSPPLGGLADDTGVATIKGPDGGTIESVQPIYLYIDTVRPALTVSQGSLSLNGNAFTIDADSPLRAGTYPLIQVTSGTLATNGTFTASGPAIALGFGGFIEVNGNSLTLNVVQLSLPSTTTLDPVATPQIYGSVAQFTARVTPIDATGTVTFKDNGVVVGVATLDGTTGVAQLTPPPTALTVPGNQHVIVAVYSGREGNPGEGIVGYSGSVSDPAPLNIDPKPVTLSGTKTFDNTPILSGTNMSVVGNLDGDALFVSGDAKSGNQNAGSSTVQAAGSQTPGFVANRGTGLIDTGTSIPINLSAAPAIGNTLIATIGYRNATDTSNAVLSVTQAGVTWTRAAGWYKAGSLISEEIWYGNVTCRGTPGTAVTISFGSYTVRAGAQISEFSGVLYGSPLDVSGGNSGNSGNGGAFDSGPAVTTTAAPELWVAGGSMKGYGSGTTSTSSCATGGKAYPTVSTPSLFVSIGTTDSGSSS